MVLHRRHSLCLSVSSSLSIMLGCEEKPCFTRSLSCWSNKTLKHNMSLKVFSLKGKIFGSCSLRGARDHHGSYQGWGDLLEMMADVNDRGVLSQRLLVHAATGAPDVA